LRGAQPDPASQTHRSTTGNQGAVCLNRGCGHRDRIPDDHKTQ
jgi:hypothetical protein